MATRRLFLAVRDGDLIARTEENLGRLRGEQCIHSTLVLMCKTGVDGRNLTAAGGGRTLMTAARRTLPGGGRTLMTAAPRTLPGGA